MTTGARQDCPRCAELEEQVAYLKSELRLTHDVETLAKLRAYIREHIQPSGDRARIQAAKFVAILYEAKGRTISKAAMLEMIPPHDGGEDVRDPKIIDVWVSSARRAMGKDAIVTDWGSGHRLSPSGMAKVAEILGAEADKAGGLG